MKFYLATLITTAALFVSAPAFAQTVEVSPGGVTVHGRGHDEHVERRVIEERRHAPVVERRIIEERHAPPRVEHHAPAHRDVVIERRAVEHHPPVHRDVVIERRDEHHPSREVVIERRRIEHHD